jgi:hypothetical protein
MFYRRYQEKANYLMNMWSQVWLKHKRR